MDDIKEDEISLERKALKKKIRNEYLYIFLTILLLHISLPLLFNLMIGNNTGIDGIGPMVVVALLLKIQ